MGGNRNKMKIYRSIKKLRQMLMIVKVDNKNVLNSLRPITKVKTKQLERWNIEFWRWFTQKVIYPAVWPMSFIMLPKCFSSQKILSLLGTACVFSWNVCIQLWTSFLGYPNSSFFEKRVYIKVFHATIMQFQLQCKTLGAGKHEHVHTDFHDFLN